MKMTKSSILNKKYKVKRGVGKGGLGQKLSGKVFIAEGYWHELTGKLVGDSDLSNMAVYEFINRTFNRIFPGVDDKIPNEETVIYGHIKEGPVYIGHLFFEDELKEIKHGK